MSHVTFMVLMITSLVIAGYVVIMISFVAETRQSIEVSYMIYLYNSTEYPLRIDIRLYNDGNSPVSVEEAYFNGIKLNISGVAEPHSYFIFSVLVPREYACPLNAEIVIETSIGEITINIPEKGGYPPEELPEPVFMPIPLPPLPPSG